jgi:hypothetical protein
MKRALMLPMMTTLLLAGEGWAAPGGGEVDRLAAEGWLGGAGQLLEISQWVQDGLAAGDPAAALEALAGLARSARETGQREVCMEAEIGWLRLAMADADADAGDALEELARRARDWGLPREEARVWSWRASIFEDDGDWLAAFFAHDRASQAALAGGLDNRAVAALLAMARLCREHEHPWRLQHQWARIDHLLVGRLDRLDRETRKMLAEERAASAVLLGTLPPLPRAPAGPVLNPSEASAMVARSHGEIARTRFFLSNPTAETVVGELRAESRAGGAAVWQADEAGQVLTFGAGDEESAAPAVTVRPLTLRPGETVSLYLEQMPRAVDNQVGIRWQGKGLAGASAEFFFSERVSASAMVSGGNLNTVPGWPVPLYHEINQRAGGVRVEDLSFMASEPCRLEVFDGDARSVAGFPSTRLLAVDEEGDGQFRGPGDVVLSDENGDGMPDVLVGDRSRSLEVWAWPLRGGSGEPVTVAARLRREARSGGGWRTDVESGIRPAVGPRRRSVGNGTQTVEETGTVRR